MKINMTTRIISTSVILVPYRKKHVDKYHTWMKSLELQHLTGSEPLSLEEEYNMQKSWQEDKNKCTFIILDRQVFSKTGEEIESMIGDTNLYFNDPEEPHTAECEIMIAEELARGQKMGITATILMLRYGIEFLRVGKYRAKIKLDNTISIGMFKKLGFYEKAHNHNQISGCETPDSKMNSFQTSRSQVFQELTMEKQVDEEWIKWLIDETPEYQIDDNWRED